MARRSELSRQHSPLIIVSVFILISIVLTGWTLLVRADQDMRFDLHLQSRIAANVVDVPSFEKLKGNEEDIKSSYYQHLKKQLISVRATNEDYRFVYLMGKNERGEIFFYIDSEEEGAQDYSPPGQLYKNASHELKDMFVTRVGLVEGPESDEWGTWVSALTPITDPNTGATVAVFGIDVNAELWQLNVVSRVLPSIALMLVMMVIVVVYLYKAVHAFSES